MANALWVSRCFLWYVFDNISPPYNLSTARRCYLFIRFTTTVTWVRFELIHFDYSRSHSSSPFWFLSFVRLQPRAIWPSQPHLTLAYIGEGGGGENLPPGIFCYSLKTVGDRLLKLCDFYCWPITTRFLTRVWLKNDQNRSLIFLVCSK